MKHIRKGLYEKANICPTTGKVGFSASAASKRVNKFDDIVRWYDCPDCGLAHLTSETLGQTLGRHILDPQEENKLLGQENTVLKAKLRKMSHNFNIKYQKIEKAAAKRQKQVVYLIELFERENCFSPEERVKIKTDLNKL